ncbi:hypothetical protein [Massilia sp. Root335]|uniref:hypothetical protein n=1 Tax=Massilia sp. Root335 TaxID=1736517 RepID=UPI0012F66148|nr:hypothetical protein [Massilia sp. Root335]
MSMWKKSRLSTVRPAFTITTILIFLSKLTKEGKRAGSTRTRFCLQKKTSRRHSIDANAGDSMNANADTARLLSCLQKERDAPVASGTWIASLLASEKLRTHFPHAKTASKASRSAAKPARLWKTACISTGLDVQKSRFADFRIFCPTSVQHRYNAFPADP